MTTISALNDIKETLLMGPGPSCVTAEVYEALSLPTVGHMDARFIAVMNECKSLLQKLLGTSNRLTIPVSGTGSSGMETCFVNLIEKNDPVLILINGVFGVRMKELAQKLGAVIDTLEFPWGTPVVTAEVAEKLKNSSYKLVAVVHAETSTGVCNPVEEIGRLVAPTGALYLVDAVTSLGGIPIMMDEWKIDALYSGTQKCLSCPPGLSPISFSDRAVSVLTGRATPVPSWYFDLGMIIKYWDGATRAYHHTAPVNMIYALCRALRLIISEGTEQVFNRHRHCHELLVEGLGAMGLDMLVEQPYRLPMLNAVRIPAGADDAQVRTRLLKEHSIEIGAGLGPLAGKIWRIGLMGHTARPTNVNKVLTAIQSVLAQ